MLLRMVGEILASHWKATARLKLGSPNHSLVWCKIKVLPNKLHRSKHVGKPHIDTTKVQHPEKLEEFAKSLEDALSAGHPRNTAYESWNHLREAIQ